MQSLIIPIALVFALIAGLFTCALKLLDQLQEERIHNTYLTRIIDRMRRTCKGCRKFPDAEINKISETEQ